KSQALNLAEHLRFNFSSVTINEAVNNPYQPDVQYRGFTASPLLGLPQGVSVYVNGVRFNEPFGDTVNWDLIPEGALGSVALFAGSNPVFGQNTLGGALSLQVKNGFDHAGSQIESSIGEDGRFNLELQTAGNDGEFGYYVIGNYFEEDGWRDHSPSEVQQALANLTWRSEGSSLNLTVAGADNKLIGNGAAPMELLEAQGRESIYTQPDQTESKFAFITLGGDTWIDDETQVAGSVYYRRNKINTLNGDDSDYEECDVNADNEYDEDGAYESLCEFEGEDEDDASPEDFEPIEFVGYDDTPLELIDDDLEADDLDGTLNTSETIQESMGLASQVTFLGDLNGKENQLTVGFSYDYADIDFKSNTEFAELRNDSITDDRGVTGVGLSDAESVVELETDTHNAGFFLTDTITINDKVDLTVAARYNYTRIEMVGIGEHNLDLTGTHTFKRLNPSVGATYQVSPDVTFYGSYSESNRAPTPAELSCADPEDPCKLPNGFVADPPLDQVVAKTFEFGLRGSNNGYRWNAGVFHTMNHDDIIFQNAGTLTSEGFFDNVGKTRRMGVELAANKRYDNLTLGVAYSYLDATFRTKFDSVSANNPLGNSRPVEAGDKIPGLPEHNIKLLADWTVTPKFNLGAEVTYQSSQYFRGDEANENDKVDGFTLVNLRGTYQVADNVEVFARVDNVFDKEYETFGIYGEPDEVLGDDFEDPSFVGPGKPRTGVIGIRAKF
ncbi:TonB-dependent receptor, partial [Neptuniibacter sp.]|uniref:TonB-dependent receptor n=1 Tax=Neptuniibacter sp. TaxID=1962643 RepID=UPI00263385D1